jgi:hypothetical protein
MPGFDKIRISTSIYLSSKLNGIHNALESMMPPNESIMPPSAMK